jgi:hypothetical protein
MPRYRYRNTEECVDDITVIEDRGLYVKDSDGNWSPGFEFIDRYTVRAHPYIIDALLEDAEQVWTMDEVLRVLDD